MSLIDGTKCKIGFKNENMLKIRKRDLRCKVITFTQWKDACHWAWEFLKKAGIPVSENEYGNIEIVDNGFGKLKTIGFQILTLASSEWVGIKLLILRPNQFFPQYRHPPSEAESYPGKTEVFRRTRGLP